MAKKKKAPRLTDSDAWAALDPKMQGRVLDKLFVSRPTNAMYKETPLTHALAVARGALCDIIRAKAGRRR